MTSMIPKRVRLLLQFSIHVPINISTSMGQHTRDAGRQPVAWADLIMYLLIYTGT